MNTNSARHLVKKLIGITAGQAADGGAQRHLHLYADYLSSIADNGGIPLVLPPAVALRDIRGMVSRIDGFVLSGGGDIDPSFWKGPPAMAGRAVDRERDIFEILLAREACRQRKPLLGICKGAQVLNVSRGGTLINDIPSERPARMDHENTTHLISIDGGSQLRQILRRDSLTVNSTHHQAVRRPGKGLKVAAHAPDGTVEAIESADGSLFVIGVQFHPERFYKKDAAAAKLFRRFIESC